MLGHTIVGMTLRSVPPPGTLGVHFLGCACAGCRTERGPCPVRCTTVRDRRRRARDRSMPRGGLPCKSAPRQIGTPPGVTASRKRSPVLPDLPPLPPGLPSPPRPPRGPRVTAPEPGLDSRTALRDARIPSPAWRGAGARGRLGPARVPTRSGAVADERAQSSNTSGGTAPTPSPAAGHVGAGGGNRAEYRAGRSCRGVDRGFAARGSPGGASCATPSRRGDAAGRRTRPGPRSRWCRVRPPAPAAGGRRARLACTPPASATVRRAGAP